MTLSGSKPCEILVHPTKRLPALFWHFLVQGRSCKTGPQVPGRTKDAQETVLRYLTFIAAVADVKTTSDAQNLLDQWASPLGSWKLKRHDFLVSLGGIVGGAVAYETIRATGVSPYTGSASSVF